MERLERILTCISGEEFFQAIMPMEHSYSHIQAKWCHIKEKRCLKYGGLS